MFQPTQNYDNTNDAIKASIIGTWMDPSDILSLLLILGGDIIQRAIAQQAGKYPSKYLPVPVPFSFGWVAYAFSSLLAAIGENRLMPEPDCTAVVINTSSAQYRDNRSWLIGRLLRDYEALWMHPETKRALEEMLTIKYQKDSDPKPQPRQPIDTDTYKVDLEAQNDHNSLGSSADSFGTNQLKRAESFWGPKAGRRLKAGLCIAIYDAIEENLTGTRRYDAWFWSGYVVAAVQIGIAAAAYGAYGDWLTFIIVISGTGLAFYTSSLTQWQKERISCRSQTKKSVAITRGNGAQHVIVIRGNNCGLDFEDLAGWSESDDASIWTKVTHGILLCLWVVILILVSAVYNNTWLLLLIGAIGMLHTLVIAGAARRPEAFGIHLVCRKIIVASKVKRALQLAEAEDEMLNEGGHMGQALGKVFLPTDEILPADDLRKAKGIEVIDVSDYASRKSSK